jgi:hypothetical protein
LENFTHFEIYFDDHILHTIKENHIMSILFLVTMGILPYEVKCLRCNVYMIFNFESKLFECKNCRHKHHIKLNTYMHDIPSAADFIAIELADALDVKCYKTKSAH